MSKAGQTSDNVCDRVQTLNAQLTLIVSTKKASTEHVQKNHYIQKLKDIKIA